MHQPTLARIASVAQQGRFFPTLEGNVQFVLGLVDQALEQRPDLICLPEGFNTVGLPKPRSQWAEPLDGPTVQAFSARARQGHCYIVCPIRTVEQEHRFNSAIVLGRDGELVGVYRKVCPVATVHDYSDFEEGVTPGQELPVFDLDFGPVGLQICYDVGFPENWQRLAEAGARLVLWPSAYDGGFPLRAYAYLHHYYVVSSTRTGQARVVDPVGEILAETTADQPVVVRDVNLDYIVSHWDWNMGVPDRIRAQYGDRVAIRDWDKGSAHFIVEPMERGITTRQLQEEFGFESTAAYHQRHRDGYAQVREGRALEAQAALHGDRPQWGK